MFVKNLFLLVKLIGSHLGLHISYDIVHLLMSSVQSSCARTISFLTFHALLTIRLRDTKLLIGKNYIERMIDSMECNFVRFEMNWVNLKESIDKM